MRTGIFRIIAGLLGIFLVAVALPIYDYAPSGFWPSWAYIVPFFLFGGVLLIFAFTGRVWPSFYGRKVFGDDENPKDR